MSTRLNTHHCRHYEATLLSRLNPSYCSSEWPQTWTSSCSNRVSVHKHVDISRRVDYSCLSYTSRKKFHSRFIVDTSSQTIEQENKTVLQSRVCRRETFWKRSAFHFYTIGNDQLSHQIVVATATFHKISPRAQIFNCVLKLSSILFS